MQEIWIPSKKRIQQRLANDLKIALECDRFHEVAFHRWLEDNAGKLAYIGKDLEAQIIEQVARELQLTQNDQFDYVREG